MFSKLHYTLLNIVLLMLLNAILRKLYRFKKISLERTLKTLIESTFRRFYVYSNRGNHVLIYQNYRALFVLLDVVNRRYKSGFKIRNSIRLRYAIA